MPRPSDTNAVGGAGPAPHQTPVPTGVPLKGGKDPRQRVGGSVQGKETYTHPPAKAPRRITIRISIHAPLRGATPVPPIGKYGCGDFNPRPPCGGDPAASRYSFCLRHFNPRPLAGATTGVTMTDHAIVISIHAPLRGRHEMTETDLMHEIISIHAPLRGRLFLAVVLVHKVNISIHAPLRGRREERQWIIRLTIFQSTPPCGGD